MDQITHEQTEAVGFEQKIPELVDEIYFFMVRILLFLHIFYLDYLVILNPGLNFNLADLVSLHFIIM